MRSKQYAKKLLSLIIASVMIVTMLPVSALAADVDDVMIEDQAETIVEEAVDVSGEVVEEAAEVPDIEDSEDAAIVDGAVDEIAEADPEELAGDTDALSRKVKGVQSGSNMRFEAKLAGLTVSAVVPTKRAAKGSYMKADIVDVSAYEDAVAKKNYGKVITGLYGLKLHFVDKKGKEIKHINTSSITVTVDGLNSSYYFIGRIDNKVKKIQRGTEPTFTFTEKKAYTYVIAGLEDDGLVRATAETDSKGNKCFNLDEENVNIEVVAPKGAFADGVAMEASDVTNGVSEDGEETLVGASSDEVVAAYEISFYNEDGDEQQPSKGVAVTINTPLDMTKSYELIHIADDGTRSSVEGAKFTENGVEFTADSFSVYAVIEPTQTGEYARATLNFYGKDTTNPIATFYVKTADLSNDEALSQIVYDPGAGELDPGEIFKGWSISSKGTDDGLDYNTGTEPKNIEDIRAFLKTLTIAEGDVYNIYAMLFTAYNVQFKDEDLAVIHGETLINKSGEAVTYKINTDYTPKTEDQQFQGWYATTTATEAITPVQETYQVGDTVSIAGDVIFTPNAPKGNWLVFDSNLGSDTENKASYTPPQFIKTGETGTEPTAPTRVGYTFGGWYTDAACTTRFNFSTVITGTTHTPVYAKWTAVATASYTVIIWKQSVNLDGYDFAEAFSLNGTPNTTVSTISGSGDTATITGRPGGSTVKYTGFEFGNVDQNVTIKANGTSVVNVYFNRKQYTLTFQIYSNWNWNWNTVKTITAYYEQDISSNFPIVGTNGTSYDGYVWYAQNSSVYGGGDIWVPYIDVMREENTTFHGDRMGTNNTRHYRYYTEVLPGDNYDVQFDGKYFELHADVGIACGRQGFNATYEEDFSTMDAFSRYKSDPSLSPGQPVEVPRAGFNFYYTRNKYPITYQDGIYVNGDGVATDQTSRGTLKTMPESDYVYYQASLSNYENYFTPTFAGYVFAGWYLDESCTHPVDWNSTMPKGGLQVYAKWVAVQYRVFLHANVDSSDTSLDWGGQSMCFRINENEKIANGNKIVGTRDEYELVGWYIDAAFTTPYNFDAYTINSGLSYLTAYDQTEPTELNKYSNPTSTTNADAAANRVWIQKKLDLYAKWRSTMKGARGIQIIYDAVDGTNSANNDQLYTDPLYHLDTANAIAAAAATPTDTNLNFVHWIVQKWDGTDWVNTSVIVSPGDSFEVLKSNAKKEANPDWDGESENDQYLYTIKVIAEYEPKDVPTPTHITWYDNFTENPVENTNYLTDNNLKINEAVNIEPADRFERPGYKFLGWARVDTTDNQGTPIDGYTLSPQPLTADDLYLIYNDETGEFTTEDGTVVTQVAADENYPYHDLYAVWEDAYFYIFHSSSGDLQAVPISKDKNATEDLTTYVERGKLYGGYYSGYGAYTVTKDNKKAAKAAQNRKTHVTNDTYDGTNLKYSGVRYWTKSEAQTASGKSLKPETDKVYYLKEVPGCYLGTNAKWTYDWAKNYEIQNIYLLSVIDDTYYTEAGFVVTTVDEKGEIVSQFNYSKDKSDGTVTKVKANDLIGQRGYLAVVEAKDYISKLNSDNTVIVEPYWKTLDSVKIKTAGYTFSKNGEGNLTSKNLAYTAN